MKDSKDNVDHYHWKTNKSLQPSSEDKRGVHREEKGHSRNAEHPKDKLEVVLLKNELPRNIHEMLVINNELLNKNVCCSMCNKKFKNDSKVVVASCLHKFHYDCIKNFLKNKNHCPVCLSAILGRKTE